MRVLSTLFVLAFVFLFLAPAADARHRRTAPGCNVLCPCGCTLTGVCDCGFHARR